MNLSIVTGHGNPELAQLVAAHVGVNLLSCELARFPDGELHVQLGESVRGSDAYLLQSTGPPVDERLFELFLLADACWRAGARAVTAVVPYFGYARQDRRATGGQPVSARVVADCLRAAGIGRMVALDLHSPPIEGFFSMPMEHLSAVPLLAEAIRKSAVAESVIVAPDLGAAKLADQYARLLNLPSAVVHKTRVSGEEVVAERVVGAVAGLAPIIVDDMISTGGTVEAAARAVIAAGAIPHITVAATHGLFVGAAVDRLQRVPIERMFVTDSLPTPDVGAINLHTVSVSHLLGESVSELHEAGPAAESPWRHDP